MKFSLTKFKPNKQIQNNKGLECLNCNQPLSGNENFCSYCGQKNTTQKLSFGVFINNLFSGFLSYDSRFWKTFISLLISPGKVSKDYIEGKRARFVNPFQLYLNVSIIFFLILGITTKIDSTKNSVTPIFSVAKKIDSLAQENKQQIDSVFTNKIEQVTDSIKTETITGFSNINKLVKNTNEYQYYIKSDSAKTTKLSMFNKFNDFQNFYTNNPNYSSNRALDSLGYEKTFWNMFQYQQVFNANKNIEQIANDGGRNYFKKLTSYISISLFILLPLFTLFFKLLYFTRNFTYMEHLVVVFHIQTVLFLLLIIFYILNFFIKMGHASWVFILLFLVYIYKALRHFYNEGHFKTIFKYILLNSFYLFLALIGFITIAIISFTVD